MEHTRDPFRWHAASIGVVAALVGFSSSFAVVIAGLRAVGADADQAASGLVALSLAQGIGIIAMSLRYRMPVTLAWSTPGAAMLAASAALQGGWSAAVGAFLVSSVLIVVTGLWGALGRAIARIPPAIAQAMLAGVLVPLCLAPVTAAIATPLVVAPVILVWLVLQRLAPRWSAPAAFAVALGIVAVDAALSGGLSVLAWPALSLTAPSLDLAAVVGIALPLYLVTMASQNVPGAAVMSGLGYAVPWRPSMLVTGALSAVSAPFGGHAVNLAAITAALPASAEAHPDPARRWIASVSAGASYLVLGLGATTVTAVVALAPAGVIESVAGLALLGTLAASLAAAMREECDRIPAALTLVVAASGVTVAGVGAAFWALVAGLVAFAVLRWGRATGAARVPVHATPASST